MNTEFADVTDHDVTTIVCVCGNTVSDKGLIQANSRGNSSSLGAKRLARSMTVSMIGNLRSVISWKGR